MQTTFMNQDAEFYNSAWNHWDDMVLYSPAPRFRRQTALSKVLRLKPSTLADVGCGNGEFLGLILRHMPDIHLTGIDISRDVIEKNRQRFKHITFFAADINLQPVEQRFEMVTCMEVVEHCEDFKTVVKRLAAMTDKWLFISVPCGPVFPIDRRVGHVRHFQPNDLTGLLKQEGFRIAQCQQWGFPFFNLYKHLINWSPETTCREFLSEHKYTFSQKLFCNILYTAFQCCLPFGGYQLFILAERETAESSRA